MVKDFRFVVTLHDVQPEIRRADVKERLEQMLSTFTKKHCTSVRVSRYNLSSEVRKGKVMQKMANDVLTDAVKKKGNKNGN
jgi:hypothetical protein